MNVPIWVLWKELIFIVYWPSWVVPLYVLIRKKHLKKKLIFFMAAIFLCFSLQYLLEFSLGEAFFNSGNSTIEKFADDYFTMIDNFIFVIQFLIPMLLMHLCAKTKLFNRTTASSGAQGACAH